MVDYSFLNPDFKLTPDHRTNGEKRGRVEFFDADLPGKIKAGDKMLSKGGGPLEPGQQLTTTDLVRQQIKAGEKNIESMRKEADQLTVLNKDDFERAVEMIGQIKNLKKALIDSVDQIIQPIYQEYKAGRNILTSFTPKLDAIHEEIKHKQDAYAYKAEMQRREAERLAWAQAAKLQKKLDAEQKKIDEAEKKAAKVEGREAVTYEPITVDAPVVPKEIKAKTESGSAKIEMVLVHTITNINSPYILKLICDYCGPAYETLADQAIKKALKAGAIGLAGAEGIKVEEKAVAKHRRR